MKRIIDRVGSCGIAIVLLLAALAVKTLPATAQEGLALPAPAVDMPASQAQSEVMVIAGGCFWGVQGVFQHVKGVSNAVSGYAGGAQSTATYEQTNDGTTGHAESVQITFDPRQVTYGQLLQVFFSVPTIRPNSIGRVPTPAPSIGRRSSRPTRNRPRWRKPTSRNSTRPARSRKHRRPRSKWAASSTPPRNITRTFSCAIPPIPYIVYNDLPKIENLKRLLPGMYRASPVLVSGTR